MFWASPVPNGLGKKERYLEGDGLGHLLQLTARDLTNRAIQESDYVAFNFIYIDFDSIHPTFHSLEQKWT